MADACSYGLASVSHMFTFVAYFGRLAASAASDIFSKIHQ